jgi:hypothetical protein
MALAPYYDKAAIAASQVVAGFRPDAFREALEGVAVGVSFGDQAARSPEGRALLDLQVRLLARLYPALALRPDGGAAEDEAGRLTALARAVNPRLDLVDDAPVGVAAGVGAAAWARTVHAGCDGWNGRAGGNEPLAVGATSLPFGAGAAACLAASAVFRLLLDPAAPRPGGAGLSCADGVAPVRLGDPPPDGWALPARSVLVGCGAIGQAAVWALAACPVTGTLHVVDGEAVDDGNLQRYVLSGVADLGRRKTDLAADHVNAHSPGGRLRAVPVDAPWAQAHARLGPAGWEAALSAVDSAAARRAVQASLPAWTANAWTQPGDLGVSDHDFERGACLACLYQPPATGRDEDDIVAEALGVPEARAAVRTWLHTGEPPPADFLELVAARLGADPAALEPFAGRGVRSLYVDGICGGQVLPLGTRKAGNDVHVPLAHQSALAGVLLAARLVRRAAGHTAPGTEITRLDVRDDPPARPTQPAAKDPAGRCLCQDDDYRGAYRAAWR